MPPPKTVKVNACLFVLCLTSHQHIGERNEFLKWFTPRHELNYSAHTSLSTLRVRFADQCVTIVESVPHEATSYDIAQGSESGTTTN